MYGRRKAFRMACEFRRKKENEILSGR
jgi:hypothetical protein